MKFQAKPSAGIGLKSVVYHMKLPVLVSPVVYHMKIQVLHSGSTVIVTVTAPLKGGLLPVTITGAITGQNGVGVFETSLFCWLKTGSVCLRRRCFAYSAPFSAHG